MARTRRRGKVSSKHRVQTRRNNAMKPSVQSRRKKSVRRKRPRRSRGKLVVGGQNGVADCERDDDDDDEGEPVSADTEEGKEEYERVKREFIEAIPKFEKDKIIFGGTIMGKCKGHYYLKEYLTKDDKHKSIINNIQNYLNISMTESFFYDNYVTATKKGANYTFKVDLTGPFKTVEPLYKYIKFDYKKDSSSGEYRVHNPRLQNT